MATTTSVPAGYAVDPADLHDADDRLIAKAVAFTHAVNAEAVPEDPPSPDAAVAARLRLRSKFGERSDWLAWKGDELVGRISLHQDKSGSNEHIREIELNVLPAHRRRGVASALFAAAVASLPGDGGAKLVETWTSTRAPAGYRLETIEDVIPDRLMGAAAEAFNAINRMPREGLEMEDWRCTPELIRDWERQMKARGQRTWTLLASRRRPARAPASPGSSSTRASRRWSTRAAPPSTPGTRAATSASC